MCSLCPEEISPTGTTLDLHILLPLLSPSAHSIHKVIGPDSSEEQPISTTSYRSQSLLAMQAGWVPTDVYDDNGRALWLRPGIGGLVPLEAFHAEQQQSAAA